MEKKLTSDSKAEITVMFEAVQPEQCEVLQIEPTEKVCDTLPPTIL